MIEISLQLPLLGFFKAAFILHTFLLMGIGILIYGMKYKGWFEDERDTRNNVE